MVRTGLRSLLKLMHDDDESVTEAAERIVAEENERVIARSTHAIMQVPELMEGLAGAVAALTDAWTPMLEKLRKLVAEIEADQRDTLAFMEDQFDY